MIKKSISFDAKIMLTVFTVLGMLWSFTVILFLKQNMMASIIHVIIYSVLSVISSIGIYSIFFSLSNTIKKEFVKYLIALVLFSIFYAIIIYVTPYSPNHDSYDLEIILKTMLSGNELSSYNKAYMNFFVTNKLVVYLYYPFVLLIKNVEIGVRVANAVFLWIASVGISSIVGQIKNFRAASYSLFFTLVLFPALLLSGPYIYPPAIMLFALVFALFIHKEPIVRVFGYIFAGILFTIRPLSLGTLFVYIIGSSIISKQSFGKKILFSFLKTALLFAVCFSIQWYIGQVMHKTSLHPAENLNSAMELWTIEVGTRNQGDETGYCNYSAADISPKYSDSISKDFQNLWHLYSDSNINETEIHTIKSNLKNKLYLRAKNEIFSSFDSFTAFTKAKFSNYYKDYYKPYFYALNINHEKNYELLYKNYDYRYCLYENSLLFLFYTIGVMSIIFTIIRVYRNKKTKYEDWIIIILFFGVICTSVVSIMLTEVGKRLIFDSFVPMMVLICTSLFPAAEKICNKKKSTSKKTSYGLVIVGIVGFYLLMYSIRIPIFKNASVDIDDARNVTIKFAETISSEKYIYVDNHSSEHSMKGYDELYVKYGSDIYVPKPVYFGIKLPNGQHIYISYLE